MQYEYFVPVGELFKRHTTNKDDKKLREKAALVLENGVVVKNRNGCVTMLDKKGLKETPNEQGLLRTTPLDCTGISFNGKGKSDSVGYRCHRDN